jgi:signal transduction histidine kinase
MYAVDVTAQVLARREVEQALELREEAISQMRETLKMREEFLAAAAHDLRNPITIIKARAQLLKRQVTMVAAPNTVQLVENAASIESNATRMTAMVGELLDLARLQSGQPLRLDRRPTDLVAIVRQTVADHQQRTNRHRICIETTERELMGSWDPVRVTRVLSNLLENAIKFSPEGGDIVVTVGHDAHALDYAMFQVQDFGVGISEADLSRVFERFFRGRNVVGRIAGTGIGLNAAYHIVQAHGGTIDVVSQEGAGSTFTVRLPIMGK